MYQTQYPKQPPSFTYLSHQPTNPNPDPNSFMSYPEPAIQFAEPAIYTLGTDPYAHPAPYPLTHVGYEGQTQYYQDPNVGSANWVTRQAGLVRYDSGSLASTSLNSGSLASTSLISPRNSYWTDQILMNNVTMGLPKQSKVIQPMRCEVCKIDCNSKEVFEKHISGKKHLRNMQSHINSSAATLQNSYSMVNNMSLPNQIGGLNVQMISGASSVAAGQELEKKKQKLLSSGATVDSVRVCTICNVACNGEEVFTKHLTGKKHATQASLMCLDGVGQYFAEIKAQNNSFWSGGLKKTKVVQSAWCEVCKINCNSNEVYVKHIQGKKHLKNQENLERIKNDTSTPALTVATTAANLMIGPMENAKDNNSMDADSQKKRAALSQATVENLETKKRKVMEGGAAAAHVRICSVCNVVCNSQMVFNSHIAGQKHAAMVKKQVEGLTESAAARVVDFT